MTPEQIEQKLSELRRLNKHERMIMEQKIKRHNRINNNRRNDPLF